MNIYEQFDRAFKNISSHVVLDTKGQLVARITFKKGEALTCYLHIIGLPMVKGCAKGYGYDRASASLYEAINDIPPVELKVNSQWEQEHRLQLEVYRLEFIKAIKRANSGSDWNKELLQLGFNVITAI